MPQISDCDRQGKPKRLNVADDERRRSADELATDVRSRAEELVAFARREAGRSRTFEAFEKGLIPLVFTLARTVIMLFLEVAEQRVAEGLPGRVVKGDRTFRIAPAQGRNLMTWFGLVRYWRTYLREVVPNGQPRHGFHPLDAALGLCSDRFSPHLMATAVRMATRMSFGAACQVLGWFMEAVPSTEVVQAAVIGYGRHTQEWFATAPVPEGDGEVLVIMIDSKGAPTATEEELRKRRGKRPKRRKAASPRHRGRKNRQRRTKRRRKKGDKSKNAKMATMVVMYTLRRSSNGLLLGPLNKRYYASFAPKRHAVEYARREATRRGFPPGTGKTVQLVTDGDNDLARYIAELFPKAIHTIDVMHVVEKLWEAGSSIHREGSQELATWVEQQCDALYGGRVGQVAAELSRQLAAVPKTGPGNKWRRQKLDDVQKYIEKRQSSMNYAELMAADLELGSGPVEGAIKSIIGHRMDHGGMRWIKERAEALLQLRCIDANGQWEPFVDGVHERQRAAALKTGVRPKLQQRQANALPQIQAEAA
jgi:hypothetical protein